MSNSRSGATALVFADLLLTCTMLSLCCWDKITGDYFTHFHINTHTVLHTQTTSSPYKKPSSASPAFNHNYIASLPLPHHPFQKTVLLLFPSCIVQKGSELFSSVSAGIIGRKAAVLEQSCYGKYLHTYASHHFI